MLRLDGDREKEDGYRVFTTSNLDGVFVKISAPIIERVIVKMWSSFVSSGNTCHYSKAGVKVEQKSLPSL
jgi:hypothetical protein